jgi:hypothetical protein
MTIINNIEIDNTKYHENEIKKTILYNEPIEEKLHVIIVLSNPCNYAIRYILTKEFIRRMKDEPDVILYIVELAYGNQDYYITEFGNDKHLRLRSHDTPLWHKENMINIGIKKLLPDNWKAVAWIDADIEFENSSWAMDTLKILNGSKDIVQLFSHNVFMDANGDTEMLLTGLGFQYIKKTKRSNRIKNINSYWHPGFAWACTRKLYEKMNGLYEYAITGDGDMQIASCLLSNYSSALPYDVSDDYKNSLKEFENRVKGCRLGYVPGVIRHYYHGSINSRKYDMREQILTTFNYSPTIHLTKNKSGLLIPSNNCPKELLDSIMKHFQSKREDDSIKPFNQIINDTKQINLIKLLEYHFDKPLSINCILLNLKKDIDRFQSVKEELNKLSINAEESLFETTYWMNKEQLQNDLNFILTFLRKYNKNINSGQVTINEFYEQNDPFITIQSAPLACYCSHVKAMIHGFYNFENYTIICEDDISVNNLSNIINLIPNDWDVICFNSLPMNMINDNSYYKFNGCFYYLHFYIIKNKCFETIFQNLYPITDQIDIIFSRMHDKLNIYNIPNTIYQKNNFITNIQNNLHVVYNTPVYKKMVNYINDLEKIILNMVENQLPKNNEFNKRITEKIMEDVIYNNVFNNIKNIYVFENVKEYDNTRLQDDSFPIYDQINKIIQQQYKIKDNINQFILHLISEIEFIILSFNLHNHDENGIKMKAYNFGSSSSVYKLDDDIVKVYNKRLRWVCDEHNKINHIFEKELQIMSMLNLIKSYDNENMILRMNYKGETLYNNFILPSNYKEQIISIFDDLNSKNIYYPEFNINNIVVKDDKISFIDFGLSQIVDDEPDINKENKTNFIELLEILNNRFKEINDSKQRRILYNTFINNMKTQKKYISNIF